MSIRRAAFASTFLIGCAVPLAVPASVAAAPPPGSHSLCAPPADTVGPAITLVTFGQPSIDLNSGSRVQTVTVTASDTSGDGNPSGVDAIFLGVHGNRFGANPKLVLTSGTSASGQWTGQFVVSKYAHAGPASIYYLQARDLAGNYQNYPGYGNTPETPNALSLHPDLDPTFTVTGTPAHRPPPKRSGNLTSFSFSPTTVNTKESAKHVQVTAQFTGPAPARVSAYFYPEKRPRHVRPAYLHATLKLQHGEWSGSVRVPRWLGRQTVTPRLYASWGRGYQPSARSYDAEALHKLGAANKLSIVSGLDTKPPALTSLSFSPTAIDSTPGAVQVTVTAQATDARSGVEYIDVSGGIRHGINGVGGGSYPLAAAGIGYLSSDNFHVRLKKTATGDWVGTTKVRRCVPSGTYKLSARVADAADNSAYYSTKRLANAGITSTVDVTSKHGDVADPYVYSAATLGALNWLILNFSEGVANVSTSTLTVYPLSPASTRFTTPATVTEMTCYNGETDDPVDCSGSDGLVTAAVLTVPELEAGKKYEVYANLNQITSQLVDGNRNAMQWNYGAREVIGARSAAPHQIEGSGR